MLNVHLNMVSKDHNQGAIWLAIAKILKAAHQLWSLHRCPNFTFNQEKAQVGAFSVIVKSLFEALVSSLDANCTALPAAAAAASPQ